MSLRKAESLEAISLKNKLIIIVNTVIRSGFQDEVVLYDRLSDGQWQNRLLLEPGLAF